MTFALLARASLKRMLLRIIILKNKFVTPCALSLTYDSLRVNATSLRDFDSMTVWFHGTFHTCLTQSNLHVRPPFVSDQGGDLHASHRALRANYIINSRPNAISAFDNRRRESRKSSGECSVQQRPISHRIFFICLPAVCLLVKRHR